MLTSRDTASLLAITTFLVGATPTPAQGGGADPRDVQIRSVDFGAGILELHNFGAATIDLTGWRFCSHDSDEVRRYSSPTGLAGRAIEPGTSVFVHFGDDAPANDPDRVDRSTVGPFALPLDRDAYGLQLFRPDANGNVAFGDSQLIADHLQWNIPGQSVGNAGFRSGQAVAVGLWTDAGAFAATSPRTFRLELLDTRNGRLHGPADYRSFVGEITVQELLVDPVGPDAGNQLVELRNDSGRPFTPRGWFACVPFDYAPLPAIELPAGGVVRVHVAAAGVDTATDWYLPSLSPLDATDAFFVFRSNAFGNADDIVDMVAWGGATSRVDQAVRVGQWPSVQDTVDLPPNEGETAAYAGAGIGSRFWYRDTSPTLGAANDLDDRTLLGGGCATGSGVPVLEFPTPAVDGNADFTVEVAGAPIGATVGVQVGLAQSPVRVLGCDLLVLGLWFRVATADGAGRVSVAEPIPSLVAGRGIQLGHQAFVLDPSSPNGLAGATPGVRIDIR